MILLLFFLLKNKTTLVYKRKYNSQARWQLNLYTMFSFFLPIYFSFCHSITHAHTATWDVRAQHRPPPVPRRNIWRSWRTCSTRPWPCKITKPTHKHMHPLLGYVGRTQNRTFRSSNVYERWLQLLLLLLVKWWKYTKQATVSE